MPTGISARHSWFAVRVKSNRERVTSLALSGKGYEVFLPTYRKPGSNTEWPLFPGYLFSSFDIQNRLPVLTVPGVVHIVGFGNQPAPVDQDELESVRILVKSAMELNPNETYSLGEPVRVISGPLSGAQGQVAGFKPQKLLVSLTLLQRVVSVELKPEWVTAAPAASQAAASAAAW